MDFRNQNRPPRSPTAKKGAREEIPLDKRRRIAAGAGATVRQPTTGRARQTLGVNNRQDAYAKTEIGSTEGYECSSIEFTKEEVDALLKEKLKGFDTKKRDDQIKRLKVCIKWFQQLDESHGQEKEKFQAELKSAEKRCSDTEAEMKNKTEELNVIISDLRQTITSLQEKVAKEEAEKLDAIVRHRKEQEARSTGEKIQASLSVELEKVQVEKVAAEKKAASIEDLYNQVKEYNTNLQNYNKSLQADCKATNSTLNQVEMEKLTIIENLSNMRGLNKALQDQVTSLRASQDEHMKQKESLEQELKCLRQELQEVRDGRCRLVTQVQALNDEIEKYQEYSKKSCDVMDSLTDKTSDLEKRCSYQSEQICMLQQQLTSAKDKLQMADSSVSITRSELDELKRLVSELQDRLINKEIQVLEGEKLRKKLHNTILELKGNIRVFCRVRPLLPDDDIGTDMIVSYPRSTEALGRGIELVQSGQKYPFTFDKVFNHEACQEDVFVEMSQLVQSALDGYKVCIFAYGQTGSGKTYTMMGRPDAADLKGMIPRSLEQIFEASQSLRTQGWKYKMQASMLEIYNENIRDLLLTNRSSGLEQARTENVATGKSYTIKHDANGNTHVSDLTIIDVCSLNEISSLLLQAAHSRSVGRTQMNEQSSRSHFVFTLRICGVNENTEQQVQGVLNLIDLAGSERLSRSGATGDRLKETQAINKSLSALSDVIFALAKKEEHVPFRNSKLTYLLQPCLGGDSKTLMFVNISPEPSSASESLCSLRFAARVNACEIGIPRRQTSMKALDSRLSYG